MSNSIGHNLIHHNLLALVVLEHQSTINSSCISGYNLFQVQANSQIRTPHITSKFREKCLNLRKTKLPMRTNRVLSVFPQSVLATNPTSKVKSMLDPCEDENDDIQDDDVSLEADFVQRDEHSESVSEISSRIVMIMDDMVDEGCYGFPLLSETYTNIGVQFETLNLNEDTLWIGIPGNYTNPDAPKSLSVVRKLVDDGQYAEATTEAVKLSEVCSTLLPSIVHQLLGDIKLEFDDSHALYIEETYSRVLDLDIATTKVKYSLGEVEFVREHFPSNLDQVIMTKISGSKSGSLSFMVSLDSKLHHHSS
ncbi:Alpha-L-fucosidase 2, partial [Camellia lanceoleosa]